VRVLLADDSPTIRGIVTGLLSGAGYRVEVASDGVEALERFFADPPDLVLLDLYMPRLTGWVVCRVMKDDPVGSRIPVVVLTGFDGPEDTFWADHSGADGFITKDQIGDQLLARINALSAGRALAELAGGSRWEGPAGPPDVLARVCEVLDRKLYEATVVNEIIAIGIRRFDIDGALDEMLGSLRRLVAYDAGAIALLAERTMAVRFSGPVPQPAAAGFQALTLRRINELADADLQLDDMAVSVLHGGPMDEESEPAAWQSVHVQPLVARGRLLGVLSMAASGPGIFEGTAHRTLRTAGPALAAVVDGCRRAAAEAPAG